LLIDRGWVCVLQPRALARKGILLFSQLPALKKGLNALIQRAREINQRITDQPPLRAIRCNRL